MSNIQGFSTKYAPKGQNIIARGKTPGKGFKLKIVAPTGRNKTDVRFYQSQI
jgi:hypothetical protein